MLAHEVMTENPRTIRESDTIGEAILVLETMDVRHLPVVDSQGNLVGMLSDRDLRPIMRSFEDAAAQSLTPVAEIMTAGPITVEVDSDIKEVIETILEQRVGAVPVVDGDGNIAGIISYVDLLRVFAATAA